MKRTNPRLIPERFLRQLWKQTAFRADGLKTIGGQPVEILSPGMLNTDGGPDFTGARIRIGGVLYRGDVELHRTVGEWKTHAHHLDPKYNSVILHVVLHSASSEHPLPTVSNRLVPVLLLEPYLEQHYHDLWQQMILGERAERLDRIKCFNLNETLPAPMLQLWLGKLAVERIELKVRRFEERLLEMVKERKHGTVKEEIPDYKELPFGLHPEELPPAGEVYTARDYARPDLWEQLLYEGMFEALGYSKNQAPFVKLARNMPLSFFKDIAAEERTKEEMVLRMEAALLAVAGLLPVQKEFREKDSALRMARLRSLWNRIEKRYTHDLLHEAEWQFFRLRPENFPTIRLAGAARVIERMLRGDYLKAIIGVIKNTCAGESVEVKIARLEAMFIVPADEYWSNHFRFGESSSSTIRSLVGRSRAREILLNVVLPICFLYARMFKDRAVREGTLEVYEHCSAQQENTIVRKIDDQLARGKFKLDSAMAQQGALQLYKIYCLEERCEECAVGKVVFKK